MTTKTILACIIFPQQRVTYLFLYGKMFVFGFLCLIKGCLNCFHRNYSEMLSLICTLLIISSTRDIGSIHINSEFAAFPNWLARLPTDPTSSPSSHSRRKQGEGMCVKSLPITAVMTRVSRRSPTLSLLCVVPLKGRKIGERIRGMPMLWCHFH